MARHVRKGDTVMVTAGSDKGRQGKVLRVIPEDDRVVVEGINVRTKHARPTQSNPQGGVLHREMPIHISNVSPLAEGKPTRVRFQTKGDGSKVRLAARTGEQIGPPLKKAR
ncbi:MAG: 50S ribosomal protein L24 [Planctomycetes bacterium]|nr:50S ribosomal protein L24 [Planctomycetota bacterium]